MVTDKKFSILRDDLVLRQREIIESLKSELSESRAECERLARELHSEKLFGELWYFVMDEVPMKFEAIVCEYSPAKWMDEAAKLRAQKNGPRPTFDQSRSLEQK